MATLKQKLREHSTLFTSMVELIPSNYYHTKESGLKQSAKYFHNKKRKAPKQEIKDATIKAKKAKLDPTAVTVVAEDVEKGPEDESTRLIDLERIESVPLSELRQRLQSKIQEHRQKRNPPSDEGMKENARHLKKVAKNKKAKEERKKAKERQKPSTPCVHGQKARSSLDNNSDMASLTYSNLLLSTSAEVKPSKEKKKDLKKLLAKAEARGRKLEEVMEEDKVRGEELKQKIKWKQALEKVEGKKVKDDPKMLHKSLKKIEKQKKRSRKMWEDRVEQQDQIKAKRQDKRSKNIQERIDKKKSHQLGKRKSAKQKLKKKVILA